MKGILMSAVALSVLALAGCVVAPARGYYYYPHGYYYHPGATVIVRP